MKFKIIEAGRSLQALANKKDMGDVMDACDASISDEEGNDAVEIGVELGLEMAKNPNGKRIATRIDVGGQGYAYFIGAQKETRKRIVALKERDKTCEGRRR